MLTRRMYVTGGLGAIPGLGGFGRDYELDAEYAYTETCAPLASLFWNWEMALITQQARYSDLFEWQLYNAASVGMGLSGESYLYNNPLTCHGGVTRRPWFSVPCCPSNLSRTWASLGKYFYSFDKTMCGFTNTSAARRRWSWLSRSGFRSNPVNPSLDRSPCA